MTDFTAENVRANFKSVRKGKAKPRFAAGLSAYRPGWKQEIRQMRARIERERTPSGLHALAIKTGAGGLMDAEFIAQTFVSRARAGREPG